MRHTNCEVLKDNLIGLRNESSAFEFATSNNLGLDNAFLLAHTSLFHVLLLEQGKLRVILGQSKREISLDQIDSQVS